LPLELPMLWSKIYTLTQIPFTFFLCTVWLLVTPILTLIAHFGFLVQALVRFDITCSKIRWNWWCPLFKFEINWHYFSLFICIFVCADTCTWRVPLQLLMEILKLEIFCLMLSSCPTSVTAD
jgi:hypothetical protein